MATNNNSLEIIDAKRKPAKIAIFRALQLGDMLCAIPAIKALRNKFKDAEITLIGLPWAKFLITRFPDYFDKFIHFPGYPGLPEQSISPTSYFDFLAKMQQEKFDLVLQMQGNGSIVNPMVELWGGKYTSGFCIDGHYFPNNGLFLNYPDKIHEIERHLKLIKFLGIELCGNHLEFPILSTDVDELNELHLPIEANKYVCIHPGSRGEWRQWPVDHFASLADYCVENGMQIVITGTQDELAITNKVANLMQYKSINLAGKTSLGAVSALIKNAFALISNCTGVSHIAAALETPSIVISMDGEPERWAPLNKDLHFTTDWTITPDYNLVLNDLKKLFVKYKTTSKSLNSISVDF